MTAVLVVLAVWLVVLTLLVRDLRRRPVSSEVRVIGSHARIVRRRVASAPHRERGKRRAA